MTHEPPVAPCEHLAMTQRDIRCPDCPLIIKPMPGDEAIAAARASLKETER